MDTNDIILKVLETQEEMLKEIRDIRVIQAKHEANLQEHIRRTALAEESISLIREELKPVKKHVDMINMAFRLIGMSVTGIATILGIAVSIGKIIGMF